MKMKVAISVLVLIALLLIGCQPAQKNLETGGAYAPGSTPSQSQPASSTAPWPSTTPTWTTTPTAAATFPTIPTVPTQPATVPTQPTTIPTQPPTVPTQPPTIPTQPTQPPTEPVQPPQPAAFAYTAESVYYPGSRIENEEQYPIAGQYMLRIIRSAKEAAAYGYVLDETVYSEQFFENNTLIIVDFVDAFLQADYVVVGMGEREDGTYALEVEHRYPEWASEVPSYTIIYIAVNRMLAEDAQIQVTVEHKQVDGSYPFGNKN